VILLASCKSGGGDADMPDDMLARVGNSVLTQREVDSRMPFGLSKEDRVMFVRGYVRNWIDGKLVSEVAYKNIPDNKAIEDLVQDYRSELIMWEYRRMMFEQHAPSFMSDDSIRSYYDNHPGDWVTESPLLKGIFVKVPESDSRLKDIKVWYKSNKMSDLENLEKHVISDTVDYEYFRERWIDWNTLKSRFPMDDSFSPDRYWNSHKTLEISDGGYVYLLAVTEFLPSKSVMPYELAVDDIKDRIANERRAQYDRELKDGLFAEGLESGELEVRIKLD